MLRVMLTVSLLPGVVLVGLGVAVGAEGADGLLGDSLVRLLLVALAPDFHFLEYSWSL